MLLLISFCWRSERSPYKPMSRWAVDQPQIPENPPFHTSPNIPAPSFCSSWRDSRGISHTSLAIVIVCGFSRRGQGTVRRQHKPSETPGVRHGCMCSCGWRRVDWKDRSTVVVWVNTGVRRSTQLKDKEFEKRVTTLAVKKRYMKTTKVSVGCMIKGKKGGENKISKINQFQNKSFVHHHDNQPEITFLEKKPAFSEWN